MSDRMFTYRATQVEQFRRWVTKEYVTFEDMCNALKGSTVANDAMRFGTAVHSAIEAMATGNQVADEHEGVKIDLHSVAKIVEYIPAGAVNEVPAVKRIAEYTPHQVYGVRSAHGVWLRGTADVVAGLHVMDFKTTRKPITDSKLQGYQDSMQWRCYLTLFGADEFTFNVQHWDERNGVAVLADVQEVRCSRYDGMESEVYCYIDHLHRWAVYHGFFLDNYGVTND
jgi:hypothetical protein